MYFNISPSPTYTRLESMLEGAPKALYDFENFECIYITANGKYNGYITSKKI